MMTQYQMFFMFNYASSDYYRTIEIFAGMMPALRTKLEQDQVAELIHDLAINSSDEAYPKEFEHFLCDVQDYYGTGYNSLNSVFEKMEGENYAWNSALKKKLAAYARKHPDLCSLKETTKEGSATYVVDKARLSLRLTEPYSEERRREASKKAKAQGLGVKTAD